MKIRVVCSVVIGFYLAASVGVTNSRWAVPAVYAAESVHNESADKEKAGHEDMKTEKDHDKGHDHEDMHGMMGHSKGWMIVIGAVMVVMMVAMVL